MVRQISRPGRRPRPRLLLEGGNPYATRRGTSWDLEPFARDCSYTGPPYGWDEERRFQLRCELDAAFFRLYLGSDEEWARDTPPALREKLPTPRHAIEHIMDSFPIVKRKDEESEGTYRTKDTLLLLERDFPPAFRQSSTHKP